LLGNGNSGGIDFSGDRTSTDCRFCSKAISWHRQNKKHPRAGSEGQAAAGIAFPRSQPLLLRGSQRGGAK